MADNFEDFGIRFVTEGAKSAIDDVMQFNKALGDGSKSLLDYDKQASKSSSTDDKLTKSKRGLGKQSKLTADDMTDLVTSMVDLSGIGGSLPNIINIASNSIGKFSLSIGGAIAAVTAFVVLATRTSGLRGIIEGFDELAQSTGQSTDAFLGNLKRASAGTVSETDLMKNANLALAGATGEVAVELGKKLPQVLELARAQARRTGDSVDHLFTSLVTGIKRSSPLLIDNTGLVLSIGDANKAYAESIGKTVDQLTEQDKQIALLNATLAAGQSSVDAMAKANETASEKIARANATITNILDDIGLALQPAFEVILDIINAVLSAVEAIVQPISRVVNFVLRAFQLMVDGVMFVVTNLFGGLDNLLFGFDVNWSKTWQTITGAVTYAFVSMARSVGQIMGSFANGLWTAAISITRIIAIIAQSIANFLVGHSPPPEGPLSEIDTGGRNTMMAWLDGFAGVSLDPVRQVAGEVRDMMGNIATMGIGQVEARLKQLDQAILPFENRLKIVQSQLDAIKEPAQAAINAIERQQESLADAFSHGNQEAANMIRNLDAQRAMIERNLAAEEARVDNAKIQLGLAKASQAEERAKLEIQKARFSTDKKIQQAAIKAQAALKEAKGTSAKGGGAGTQTGTTGAGMPIQQGQTAVDSLFSDMGDAFIEGFGSTFDMGNVGALDEATGAISSAWDEITGANPLATIVDKFSGIGGALQTSFIDPLREKIDFAVGFLTDPSQEGSLPQRINNFDIGGTLTTSFGIVGTALENSLVTPVRNKVSSAIGYLTDPSQPGSLPALLTSFDISALGIDLTSGITTWFDEQLIAPVREALGEFGFMGYFTNSQLVGSIANFFMNVQAKGLASVLGLSGLWEAFELFVTEQIVTPITGKIGTLFALEGDGSMIAPFVTLGTTITDAAGDLLPIITGIFEPFSLWVFGLTDDGGLPAIKDNLLNVFRQIPAGIWNALQNIGGIIWDTLARPFIEGINFIIRSINELFEKATSSDLYGFARDTLNIDLPTEIAIPELPTGRPSGLSVGAFPGGGDLPGAAKGGLFSSGSINTGEKGREVVTAAKPFAVFSNRFVEAMNVFANTVDTLSTVVMQSSGGMVDNRQIDNSIHVTSRGNERNAAQTAAFLAGLRS